MFLISSSAIIFMVISALISIGVPIGLTIYFYKKDKNLKFKPMFFGAATFLVFAMVLEQLMHSAVFGSGILKEKWMILVYATLAAGVFEEVGRFITFKVFLKKFRSWIDGIAFGIGHGGIEAILIGFITSVQNIVFASLINKGIFEETLGEKLPIDMLVQTKKLFLTTDSILFLSVGVERLWAIAIHIGFSMIVLYSVRSGKIGFLFLAILLHATFNIPAGLYQLGIISNIWILEALLALGAIVLLYSLRKLKLKG